jgi:Tol biopolymer transport system component
MNLTTLFGRAAAAVGVAALSLATAAGHAAAAPAPGQPALVRVNVATSGEGADDFAPEGLAISADGRHAVITSDATNLVRGDTNGRTDVFVRDVVAGTTVRASVSTGGEQADGTSTTAVISADGRYVAFASFATNLVAGDTNGKADVFVRDLATGTTERVSVSSTGAQADGSSSTAGLAISANGRYVAFAANATNLVAGDTNNRTDVFVRDLTTGTTERVSVSTTGAQANEGIGIGSHLTPSLSADGRYVAFDSAASNLVAGDTNGKADVFVRDRVAGTTVRASVGTGGRQLRAGSRYSAAISADGRRVAFGSLDSDVVAGDTNNSLDVFVHDLVTGETIAASGHYYGQSAYPALSADGRFVAYQSSASTRPVTSGLLTVVVRDLRTGRDLLPCRDWSGASAPGGRPVFAPAGYHVGFTCGADLVPEDTNLSSDAYVYGPLA